MPTLEPTRSPTPQPTPQPAVAPDNLTCATQVMFDGACPLCRAEIGLYQQAALEATTPGSPPLEWVDVSRASFALPGEQAGPSVEALRRRFHVRTAQGQWLSGAAAFVYLWAQLPRWRWLAALAKLPGLLWLMEMAYRGFLPVRPHLQRVARWLQRRHGPSAR
jgi:predicted DCC family thiol-disulfide oxidoreductase YuxK